MGFGSQSVEFIRQFFRQSEFHKPPYTPATAYGGMSTGAPYFSYGMNQAGFQGVTDYLKVDSDLVSRYIDAEDQDDSPIVASALDVYADDSTQVDSQTGKSVWIEAEDEDIRKELDNLIHKTLTIEERVWGDVRMLCKYGNHFMEIVAKDTVGVIAINALPPPTMRRIEVPKEIGRDPHKKEEDVHWDTLGYIYDPRGVFKLNTKQFIDELKYKVTGEIPKGERPMGCAVFESWEITHMRLMGKTPYSMYGWGIGEPARWIFKRLLLLEDSIILHRLTRAPSRYAFYIDVTGVPPNETNNYLNRVRQQMKKGKFVNPGAGNKMDQKYSVLSSDDDFFLPTREGRESTRVESIQGPIYDHIEDIKFFEDKLFAALKVPKPFLTYEESTAKTHLSAEDARFARTVLRVQREYRNGLKKVCKVHLATKGINPELVNFDVCMSVPSAIFELAQLEIRAAELDLAEKYDGWANKNWIKTHVLGWSDDQISDAAPDEEDESIPHGKGGGDLEKAISKRGSPKSKPPESTPSAVEPPGETKVTATDADTVGAKLASNPSPAKSDVLLSSLKKDTEKLLERLESLRENRDKTYDKKWKQVTDSLKEIRHSVERDQGRPRK